MAATDARPVPRRAAAFRYYFAIRDTAGALVTGWTGADTELSQDGAGFVDAAAEATEIGASGIGYIDLSATEMTADAVVIKVTVTNSGALPVVVTLFPEEFGDMRVDTGGTGAIAWTYTLTEDDGTTPIADARVWVTTDEQGASVVAGPLYTDASGEVTFNLDAGTYYIHCKKSGYNFTVDTEVVSA